MAESLLFYLKLERTCQSAPSFSFIVSVKKDAYTIGIESGSYTYSKDDISIINK